MVKASQHKYIKEKKDFKKLHLNHVFPHTKAKNGGGEKTERGLSHKSSAGLLTLENQRQTKTKRKEA